MLNSESSHVDDNPDSTLISARMESLATNGAVLTKRILVLELQVTELNTENKDLQAHVTQLKAENKDLQAHVTQLKAENKDLQAHVTQLKAENKGLDVRLRAVEGRDIPITIQELMRILERSLCLEAACSKSKFKRFFNIDKIKTSTDDEIQAALNRTLQERNLGENHLEAIAYLKDAGDNSAHDGRPVLCKSELIRLLTEALTPVTAEDGSQIVMELVAALEHYNPCSGNEDEPWVITDPI